MIKALINSITIILALVATSACTSSKPAPYEDKSNLVFKKNINKLNSKSIKDIDVYDDISHDNQVAINNDIVETKLNSIEDTNTSSNKNLVHDAYIEKTNEPTNNSDSNYIIKDGPLTKLSDKDLENEIDQKTNNVSDSLNNINKANVTSANFKLPTPLGLKTLEWPVEGKIISRFGKNGNKVNEGINIAAPLGTPVVSIGDGKVVYIGNNVEGYGNLLIIKHANDIMSAYAHLKEVVVERNAVVKKGESIGSVGQEGNVEQPELHFSIRKGKKTIDPESPLQF